MTAEKTTVALGRHAFGLGVMWLGLLGLAFGDFVNGQPVAKGFPERTVLAYAAGVFLLVAGAAVEGRRTAEWGSAALTTYYVLLVIILMNGRLWLAQYRVYGIYEDLAEQFAVAAGGLIVYAGTARINAGLAARLRRVGQAVVGICALVWGGAHFVYMNLTAPLVPKWLPPSQLFWAYATAGCFLLAGVAFLTGVQARLAAILLTVMLALFALLIHTPTLIADRASHFNWNESAINLALVGVAWVVADSLARAGKVER
jgi:uncharacterized membrane protein YphA (DoxX/SURF4 family)